MGRKEYVDEVLRAIIARWKQRSMFSDIGSETENIFRDAINNAFDDVEQRFDVYAQRCQELSTHNRPFPIQRNISSVERNLQRHFRDQEKATFVRDRKVIQQYYPHRAALRKCFYSLTRNLLSSSGLLMDVLLENHVMSESDQESIKGCTTQISQNEELVRFLYGKLTVHDFHSIFLPAVKIEHPHLFDELVAAIEEVEDEVEEGLCMACRVRNDVQVKRLATSLLRRGSITIPEHADLAGNGISNSKKWSMLQRRVSDEAIIESLARKYPDFHKELKEVGTMTCSCAEGGATEDNVDGLLEMYVRHVEPAVADSETDSTHRFDEPMTDRYDMEVFVNPYENTGEYHMKHNNRGICLIINNYKFDRNGLMLRQGTEVDRDNLVSTFTKLGFIPVVEENVTSDKLASLVQEYSKTDHSASDAFVCCILSHGARSIIYCSDGVGVPVTMITSRFTARRCPSLAGKPKLFFIQSDRGIENMKGCTMPVNLRNSRCGGSEELSSVPAFPKQETDGYSEAEPEVIADEADFLIGFSTVAGFRSYRNIMKGSWYITKLCEVLNRDADRHDLLTCLMKVNGEVASAREVHGNLKQVPAPVFTLTKKVHLTLDPSQS